MQKGSHNIHLMEFEVLYSDCGERDTDRRELDDGGIRFSIVHPMHLTAALGDYANIMAGVLRVKTYMHGRTFMSVVR